MQNKVWKTMEKFHMCPYGGSIVVGVSGGADSIALLHILKGFAHKQNWKIKVIHVHHGLRGAEADRDREFVEEICRKWEIACKVCYFDVAAEAKKRGLGTEEMGRILRYETFERERDNGKIAVAHNQNDQAETILMRLCRGAGVSGLVGIHPVRGHIIRPLLFCTREEIETYCAQHELLYCQDSTNFENNYSRNRVRNQVLPILEEIYPKATEHIAQTTERIAAEEEYLQKQAKEQFQKALKKQEKNQIVFCVASLVRMHKVMRNRVFAMAFDYLGTKKDISAIHFQLLEGLLQQETGKSLSLPHKMLAQKNYEVLQIKKGESNHTGFCYPLEEQEERYIPEANISVRMWISTEKNIENHADCCTKQFDYDRIGCKLFCRTRQKGDSIAIRNGRKKLKDFLIDEKIPREERDMLPLIAVEGEILWVVGKRISAAYQPDKATKRFLTVQIRRFI